VDLTFLSSGTGTVRYPSEEVVLQYAADREQVNRLQRQLAGPEKPIKELKELMANYTGLDKIYEMVDQDRNAIWERRLICNI